MTTQTLTASLLNKELTFSASRSSGPGGQNVNKVNTKVTLKFDVAHSEILSEDQKDLVYKKLASHITKEGILVVTAQDKRSQLENKEAVLLKLEKLFAKAFAKRKVRKPSKPSKRAIQNRITEKKQKSEKKKWRQKPE